MIWEYNYTYQVCADEYVALECMPHSGYDIDVICLRNMERNIEFRLIGGKCFMPLLF